jgi:penicillin amidase
MIVTANQNPFPADYKYGINGSFAPYYRAWQIRNLLRARSSWKPEDMIAVQKDVYSPLLDFIAGQLVKAYDARGHGNQQLEHAADILRKWNGQMEKGTAAPMIAAIAYDHVRLALAERASPGKGQVYESNLAGPAIEMLLRTRPKEWFKDWDQVLLKAFSEGLEDGSKRQGSNPARWDYGQYLELTIRHPVLGQIPYVGKYFNIGPVPMSGGSSSVKQTTLRVGPSMRFVAAVGDWEKSLLNVTIGESGQVLSRHYKDEWDAYYAAKSFPMPFASVSGDELKLVPDGQVKSPGPRR